MVVGGTQVISYRLGECSDEPAISTADYEDKKLGNDPYVALVRASVLAAKEGRPVPSDLTPGLLDLRAQTASLGECDYRTGTTSCARSATPTAIAASWCSATPMPGRLRPAIEEIGREHGYRVYVLVYSGCMANSLEQVDRATGRRLGRLRGVQGLGPQETIADLAPSWSSSRRPRGGSSTRRRATPWPARTRSSATSRSSQDGWHALLRGPRRPRRTTSYVVGNTPKLPRETGVCLSSATRTSGTAPSSPARTPSARPRRRSPRPARAGVGVVDALKWFCADRLCPSVVGRYITMRDSEHMTPDYSRWLAEPLAAELGLAGPVRSG